MLKRQKKNLVLIPSSIYESGYVGKLYGNYFEESGVFNIMGVTQNDGKYLGEIVNHNQYFSIDDKYLCGIRNDNEVKFMYDKTNFNIEKYNLYQNIFSRNTGILESNIMTEKCAIIIGCGSVGSLVSLELARAGVGKFVLIDNDIIEYHNICRHQSGISDIGNFKVKSIAKRIRDINPTAKIEECITTIERVPKNIFDEFCDDKNTIIVGCADNRASDIYANELSITYSVPFISIGLWERAFAGEIFYYLPENNMPCYKCLGFDDNLLRKKSVNRRIYTNEENINNVNFEPGISIDINFVTTIGIKLILDILNIGNQKFTPRLLGHLRQFTLICNTNKKSVGGDNAEIFSYPLQVTTSIVVNFSNKCISCNHCKYGK